MKNKIIYFLLLFFSILVPVAILRDPLTGIAFLSTLLALFGMGKVFLSVIFPSSSNNFDFNSFGIGFILFCGFSFLTAFFNINAFVFTIIYGVAIVYAINWLQKFFRDRQDVEINKWGIVLFLLILAFNIYPTLLIQGYAHDSVFSWVNTDATVYTSIANRVKLGIYPITIPGFGIEKLIYHFGGYALAGFIANIFHLPASGSLFGIIRPIAVCTVIFSIISIAKTTLERATVNYRIAGGLIGFFFIGSLSSIFEYVPVHFPRIDHGMKHLRGFLIGHSSLWIFTTIVPIIAFINYKIVHAIKFNFARLLLFFVLVFCTGSLNFVSSAICFCLAAFFILFYRAQTENNLITVRRNFIIILIPFILLLIGISGYLKMSVNNIPGSLIFLPVFDLGVWTNFLMVFFVLYIGIRVFGLNYMFSGTALHFGYIQFIILLAAMSFMVLLGFFVEPAGGRENDIKYGYVIIEGTFGLFSGLWLAEKLRHLSLEKNTSFKLDLKKILYPFIVVFSLILLVAIFGYLNTKLAAGFISAYLKPIFASILFIVVMLLLTKYIRVIRVNKKLISAAVVILVACSIPGTLYEFNKYRSIDRNDETVQLKAAELNLINALNKLNTKKKIVFMAEEDHHTAAFRSGYKFSSLIDAPVLNEGSNYFGVKHKKTFVNMEAQLDSVYSNKDLPQLEQMAKEFGIGYFVFNKKLLSPQIFNNNNQFRLTATAADSLYVVEYLRAK